MNYVSFLTTIFFYLFIVRFISPPFSKEFDRLKPDSKSKTTLRISARSLCLLLVYFVQVVLTFPSAWGLSERHSAAKLDLSGKLKEACLSRRLKGMIWRCVLVTESDQFGLLSSAKQRASSTRHLRLFIVAWILFWLCSLFACFVFFFW